MKPQTLILLISLFGGISFFSFYPLCEDCIFHLKEKALKNKRLNKYLNQETEERNNIEDYLNLRDRISNNKLLSNYFYLFEYSGLDVNIITFIKLLSISAFTFSFSFYLITNAVVTSIVLFGGIISFPYFWFLRKKQKNDDKLLLQLPAVLDYMANALSSGSSLIQSIDYAEKEIDQPFKKELKRVGQEIKIGVDLKTALSRLYKRTKMPELNTIITTLLIHKKAGGNLSEMLSKTSLMLKEKISLKNELFVYTSQARLSGKIIGALPIVIIAGLLIVDPEYLEPLFKTSVGIFTFILAVLGEISGFLLIKQILKIEM